jgi:hypothetical protein
MNHPVAYAPALRSIKPKSKILKHLLLCSIFQWNFLLTMLKTCDMMIVRQYDYMNYDNNHECCLSCKDLPDGST